MRKEVTMSFKTTPRQYRNLRRAARAGGVTASDIIRESVSERVSRMLGPELLEMEDAQEEEAAP